MLRAQPFQQTKGMASPRSAWLGLVAMLILSGNVLAQGKESTMAAHTTYRTTKLDGLNIFYREAGPSAPTILLLHGLPSSSRMFEPLLNRLWDKYHMIAPDYPGFGHSDAPSIPSSNKRLIAILHLNIVSD